MMPRSVPAALSRHASSSLPAQLDSRKSFFRGAFWELKNGQSVMAEDDTKAQGDEHGDAEAPVVDPAVPDSSALSDGAAAEHAAEHEAAPDAEEGGAEKDPSEMAMSEGLEEVPVEAADGRGEAEVAMDYDEEVHGAAAIKIQSRVRGGQVRARRRAGGGGGGGGGGEDTGGGEAEVAMDYDEEIHGAAAIKIQSRVRGGQVRARGRAGGGGGGGEAEVAMDYDEEIHGVAAIKIQSRVRGGQVRAREMRQQRGNPVDAAASLLVEGSGFDLESRQFSPEHEVAAIRIQSRARGMQVSGVLRTCYH